MESGLFCFLEMPRRSLDFSISAYRVLTGTLTEGWHGKKHITKKSVDALICPPGKDREFLWDDAFSGFGVSAVASGKKMYVVQYRQQKR